MAQADPAHRQTVRHITSLRVRNERGDMVSIGAFATVAPGFGPDPAMRFDGNSVAEAIGEADPRQRSSGEVVAKLLEIADRTSPTGFKREWTAPSYEPTSRSKAAVIVFPVAIMLAFLAQAALHDIWVTPLAVILVAPVCIIAIPFGTVLAGGDNNDPVQAGLVVLMGLGFKNAILIIGFARDLVMHGRGTIDAAPAAGRLRRRPIMMRSVAFIAGGVPLLIATGAACEVRHATAVTVSAGTVGVKIFGTFLTPVVYVALRKLGDTLHSEQVPT